MYAIIRKAAIVVDNNKLVGHPTDRKEWLKRAGEHGLVVGKTRRRHLKITHPELAGIVFAPLTPSDHRSIKNCDRDIRKTFGIDMRTRPEK